MYAIDWQSPGVFAYTPSMPVSMSEGRMTDWQCASCGADNLTASGNSTLNIQI